MDAYRTRVCDPWTVKIFVLIWNEQFILFHKELTVLICVNRGLMWPDIMSSLYINNMHFLSMSHNWHNGILLSENTGICCSVYPGLPSWAWSTLKKKYKKTKISVVYTSDIQMLEIVLKRKKKEISDTNGSQWVLNKIQK